MTFLKYVFFSIVLLGCVVVQENVLGSTTSDLADVTTGTARDVDQTYNCKYLKTLAARISNADLSDEVDGAFDNIIKTISVNLALGETKTKILALNCFKNLCDWSSKSIKDDSFSMARSNQILTLMNESVGQLSTGVSGDVAGDDEDARATAKSAMTVARRVTKAFASASKKNIKSADCD